MKCDVIMRHKRGEKMASSYSQAADSSAHWELSCLSHAIWVFGAMVARQGGLLSVTSCVGWPGDCISWDSGPHIRGRSGVKCQDVPKRAVGAPAVVTWSSRSPDCSYQLSQSSCARHSAKRHRHLSSSWARPIHFMSFNPIPLNSISILSSHLRPDLQVF